MCFRVAFVYVLWDLQAQWTSLALPTTEGSSQYRQCRKAHRSDNINSSVEDHANCANTSNFTVNTGSLWRLPLWQTAAMALQELGLGVQRP